MDSDGFLIGYRLFDSDAGNGWDGLVSTETGIPFTLSVWAFQHYGDVWYDYFVLLRLMY
jgi:hypothetical protein